MIVALTLITAVVAIAVSAWAMGVQREIMREQADMAARLDRLAEELDKR